MLTIRPVTTASDLSTTRILFQEYAAGLGIDLGFQDFEAEVHSLPGAYAAPRGALLLASDGDRDLGCVAVRPIDASVAEMKRLYVRPEARALGLGRSLAQAAIDFARAAGYGALRLDTLPQMAKAHALYQSLGFHSIPPYRHNPVPGTTYLELAIDSPPGPEPAVPLRSRPQHPPP